MRVVFITLVEVGRFQQGIAREKKEKNREGGWGGEGFFRRFVGHSASPFILPYLN